MQAYRPGLGGPIPRRTRLLTQALLSPVALSPAAFRPAVCAPGSGSTSDAEFQGEPLPILKGATGTKMPRTSWQGVNGYELCRPVDASATEFRRIVSPMSLRIVGNIHESRVLAALRDTLLPKLISGEIRTGDAQSLSSRLSRARS